ncbi:hypothetical protein L1987_60091 [Smallanthus sonchifolius]|uniref:Uncharacterized protein n=1 Tax=Smallanthus sonchifolius TaxID=185202 RepID=A0ACB9D798_9ASTR|nr:hypothetical protein L1987_60091 [Smallanthus sonchifolius]
MTSEDFEQGGFGDDEADEDEVMEIPNIQNKRPGVTVGGMEKRKKFNEKGPLDLYTTKGQKVFELLDRFVERIGEENVVQIITDNGSNFKLAGKMLMEKRKHIFWTPCAAHCLDLMLEDIGKIQKVKTTIEKGIFLVGYIYNHSGVLNMMREFTKNNELTRSGVTRLMEKRKHIFWTPCAAHCLDLMLEDIGKIQKVKTTIEKGIFLVDYIYNHSGVLNMMREFTKNNELTRSGVTRFATTFLTLQSLHKQKSALRHMFASEKWTTNKWGKEHKGKRANDIVFTPTVWNNVFFTLKVMGPLVRVLRLVDNEKKPAMGYVYEAMERAKIVIAKALGKQSNDYVSVSHIIDKRRNCQLHHPLHAAGYYFNPEFYCYNIYIENDKEVSTGLHDCIKKLVPNKAKQDLIMKEMIMWVNQEGFFGLEVAKRAHGKIAPAEWWKLYGKGTPNMQQLAIKVLSLTCSASGCERNWSTFEHIHSKKRNRSEHKKLQDLVFVKYNKMLKNRCDATVAYDPISLDEIDDSNEWLTGRMDKERVFVDEDLTWTAVGEASGAGEVRRTRSSQPSSSSRTLIDEDLEEDLVDGAEKDGVEAIEVEDMSDGFDDAFDD